MISQIMMLKKRKEKNSQPVFHFIAANDCSKSSPFEIFTVIKRNVPTSKIQSISFLIYSLESNNIEISGSYASINTFLITKNYTSTNYKIFINGEEKIDQTISSMSFKTDDDVLITYVGEGDAYFPYYGNFEYISAADIIFSTGGLNSYIKEFVEPAPTPKIYDNIIIDEGNLVEISSLIFDITRKSS